MLFTKKSRSHEWLSSNLMNKIYLLTSHITHRAQKKFSKKYFFENFLIFNIPLPFFNRLLVRDYGGEGSATVAAETGMTTSTSSKSRRLKPPFQSPSLIIRCEKVKGGVKNGVLAFGKVDVVAVHLDVGIDAEFGQLVLRVVDGT